MIEERPKLNLRQVQAALQADFQQLLVTSARKHRHTPPASLVALDRLGVPHARIAQSLGVSQAMVSTMLVGRDPCPQRYLPVLSQMLQSAVQQGRKTCTAAERGKILLGDVPFPPHAIAHLRARLEEAAAVLQDEKEEEKGHG
jgi:hypothetical protein